MGILIWILFGALVGYIASLIMKTDGGLLPNILIGIVGAVIGGIIMKFFGQSGVQGFNLYSTVVAVLGACILIGIVRSVGRA